MPHTTDATQPFDTGGDEGSASEDEPDESTEPDDTSDDGPRFPNVVGIGGDDDGGGGGTTSRTTSPGSDPATADDPFAGPSGGETTTFDPADEPESTTPPPDEPTGDGTASEPEPSQSGPTDRSDDDGQDGATGPSRSAGATSGGGSTSPEPTSRDRRRTVTRTVVLPSGRREERELVVGEDVPPNSAEVLRQTPGGELIGASGPALDAREPDVPPGVEDVGTGEGGRIRARIDGELVEGTPAEVAQAFEASFLEDNPEFGPDDVIIVESDGGFSVDLTRSGERIQLAHVASGFESRTGEEIALTDVVRTDEGFTLTEDARKRLAAAAFEERHGFRFDFEASDIERTEAGFVLSEAALERIETANREARRQTGDVPPEVVADLESQLERELGRDVTPGEDFTVVEMGSTDGTRRFSADLTLEFRRELAREEIETTLERRVGARRAAALGITNPQLRQAVIESTDLEEDRDFELVPMTDESGEIFFTGSLTESANRALAEETIELKLEREFGVDLEPGEDFVVREADGRTVPELTDRGRGRIQLATLDRTVRDVEATIGRVAPGQGPVDVFPGEGPVAPEARSTSRLTTGGIKARLKPDDKFTTVGAVLDDAVREVRNVTRAGEAPLPGSVTPGLERPIARRFVSGGLEDVTAFGATVLSLPARGIDVLGAGVEAGRQGELEEFGEQAGTAVARFPFVAASGLIGEFRDEPIRTTGGLVGTLLASGLVMRAIPSSRFVIQPGEEAAGQVGFRATRRVASERRAQQLFPDQEPLIFSEEFVIRQARRASERAGRLIAGTETEADRRPVATDPDLPEDRPVLLATELVDEAMGVTGPSRTAIARGRARRRAASARGRVEETVDSFEVRTRGVGSGPFGTVEVSFEPEVEEESDFRDFDPSRSEVLGGGASERAREEMIERQKEVRRMLGGDFEVETDPLEGVTRRRQAAVEAELEAEAEAAEPGLRRLEMATASELATIASAQGLLQEAGFRFEGLNFETLGLEIEGLSELELGRELERERLRELELETETVETETETEIPAELEIESEAEAEAEAEAELELEFEFEFETDADPDERPPELAVGGGPQDASSLFAGWFSETVADIGLIGGRTGRSLEEEQFEALIEAGVPVSELPTFEEIEGTEAEQEAIAEARDFFSFGGLRL